MPLQKDEITVIIADVTMKVQRLSTIPVPHEVTVVIPRAELRRSRYQDGHLIETTETILNSITISHSPRHESGRRNAQEGWSQNARTTWKYFLNKESEEGFRPL